MVTLNYVKKGREILKGDYEILTSLNGKEALDIISNKILGIVFLDIKLPDMDGFELLRRIKEMDSSIEIIMVTATNEAKAAVQAMKMGTYDYITKSFEPEEIWVVVDKVRQRQDLIIVALNDKGIVTHKHLPLDILLKSRTMRKNFSKRGTSLKEARDEFERGFILQVLKKVGGVIRLGPR